MMGPDQLHSLRVEMTALREENRHLKTRVRLMSIGRHMGSTTTEDKKKCRSSPAAAATPEGSNHGGKLLHPDVRAAQAAAALDKSSVDADLATATAWVGAAFMRAGDRCASGGMRDRDVPRKPGHTNGNLGGGTITLAQIEACLAELAQDASGVLEMYDPYQVYPWQQAGSDDIAFGISGHAEFPELKGKIHDPDGGGTHSGPFGLFQQRMLNFGGGGDVNAPEGSRTNYFRG
jgi:hypothetical protein